MDKLVIKKNKMKDFIDKLKKDYNIFAPVRVDNIYLFKKIENYSEIDQDFVNSKIPPKNILFKQTETMFKFNMGVDAKVESVTPGDQKNIIFGIRPCDAKSVSILNNVFEDDYLDPYFINRRKNTIFIGLSCIKPDINCFCTSMNVSPADSEDVDILFTEIGDRYFIEIKTEKGKGLIKNIKNLFQEPTSLDIKNKQEIETKSKDAITRNMKTKDIPEKLEKIFDHNLWKNISKKCLGCGICTYLCPTCHCFDIQDETTLGNGARVRVWDTCMNPEYTIHTSGHNPRPTRMNRTRNRVYHKFNYFPKNYDVIACVGCGRCINDCPVNIDIINIIDQAREVK